YAPTIAHPECPIHHTASICLPFRHIRLLHSTSFFFFTTTPPTAIYTLSLHDALPIFPRRLLSACAAWRGFMRGSISRWATLRYTDRKSTRLNSSHVAISYAVFCLKKKKNKEPKDRQWPRTDVIELADTSLERCQSLR